MPSTIAYRRGDIVLVSFPFTDLTSSKRRPALILSPDCFNAAGEDLVLAAITSHITDDPNAVHLRRGDFAEGGLPKASMVKTTKLFTSAAPCESRTNPERTTRVASAWIRQTGLSLPPPTSIVAASSSSSTA